MDFERLSELIGLESIEYYEDMLNRYHLVSVYADQVITMMQTAIEKSLPRLFPPSAGKMYQTNHNATMGWVEL